MRDFLKQIENEEPEKSRFHTLSPDYLQTIAAVLDGMGNVQVSCACKDSKLSDGFLREMSRFSDNNHAFEKMPNLDKLEKAVLYYWTAARFYKKGALLKDASICMKKILQVLKQYLVMKEYFKETEEVERMAEYVCSIIKNVSRKAILYLYAHNENVSIAEIQDLKDFFSLKPYEDISLEKLSLYPDVEEIVLLSMELKMICYRVYGYDVSLMPEDFQKGKSLNIIKLYAFRMSSIFNVGKTIGQQITESRLKVFWNKSLLDYMLDGTGLTEPDAVGYIEKYRTDAPIAFYKRMKDFLERPFPKEKTRMFGMDLKECGIQSDTLTVGGKLKLLEFLLKDSMFCLQRILSLLTANPSQLIHSNSYIADIYQQMFEWTQIFKFLYSVYAYAENDKKIQSKILKSLMFFITTRHISMEDEDPLKDKDKDSMELREIMDSCSSLIREDYEYVEPKTRSTIFYNQILDAIDRTNLRYIISNYAAEMALQYYRKANEVHAEGNAYKEMISNMYYLDDDLQNDTFQFHIALERYMLNSDYIRQKAKMLKDVYSKANIYNVEWYERGDRSTPLSERNISMPN